MPRSTSFHERKHLPSWTASTYIPNYTEDNYPEDWIGSFRRNLRRTPSPHRRQTPSPTYNRSPSPPRHRSPSSERARSLPPDLLPDLPDRQPGTSTATHHQQIRPHVPQPKTHRGKPNPETVKRKRKEKKKRNREQQLSSARADNSHHQTTAPGSTEPKPSNVLQSATNSLIPRSNPLNILIQRPPAGNDAIVEEVSTATRPHRR